MYFFHDYTDLSFCRLHKNAPNQLVQHKQIFKSVCNNMASITFLVLWYVYIILPQEFRIFVKKTFILKVTYILDIINFAVKLARQTTLKALR